MLGSLVDVQTEDGIKLHGFLSRTQSQSRWVWIIVHGVNGNFYGSTLLSDLALCVQRLGHDALLVNTRGHDLATFGSADHPARMGSMFETISDGQTDLLAWIRLCKQLGYANIGCIAHSLGAVKVSYALAHGGLDHQRLGLQRFVALSPPRLNTELLSMDPAKREIFDQQLQEAQQWCDKGFPHHIMRIRFPLANWVSAETFMDKYGSGLKYDYFAWWSAIGVPTLWVFGQQEVRQGSVNFRDMDQQLEQVFRNQQVLDHRLAVIPQADHSYRGQRDPLAESIQGWVQSF
jgi:pimeloyl-ACP methyl ester carboxylesterase